MNDLNDYLHVAIDAAREAGSFVLAQQKRPLNAMAKGFRDWVTDADLAAQQIIVAMIQQAFPHHHFLAEEGALAHTVMPASGQPVWIIDPLDGTSNYSRRLTNFAISIALAVEAEIQIGVVYDPVHDELFTAVAGQGSCRNGERMQRNGRVTRLDDAILSLDWGRSHIQRQKTMTTMHNLVHRVRTIRSIGSAALALSWIADGRLDAYINYNMKAWDIAAAGLILCEAGGQVSAPDGAAWTMQAQHTWSICSAGDIHGELLSHFDSVGEDK